MRKFLLVLLFIPLFLFIPTSIHSQTPTPSGTFDFNRAYADYVYNTQLYNDAYSAYQLARSQYLSSKTLVAQGNAQTATLNMLQARDQMIITYLTAIRMRVKETDGIPDNSRQVMFTQIDNDVAWWGSHKTKLMSAGSLDDLVTDSDDAYKHYQSTLLLVYQALSTVFAGRLDSERSDLTRIIVDLKAKVVQIKANGDKDTSGIERSLIDVDNTVDRSSTKESDAKNIINTMSLDQNNPSGTDNAQKFSDAKTLMKESLAYLNDAVNLISQIVTEIKTAD